MEKLNLFSHVKLWIFLKAEKSWESHHTQLSQSHTSSHQTVEILLVEHSKWCWDVLSSWSCLWGIWTRAYTTSRASSALELQQSSNNCHSHSGFSRMSRQKAWRTCQRPQGFDSCMHKTLARFRSQQDTALAAGISLVVESQIGTSTSTRTKPRETVYCWCCREIGWILFPKINWQ